MNIISHRRNTITELEQTDPGFGVEIDLRTRGDRIILQHDAFSAGEDFERWLGHYRHGTLILNVKEEGLEQRCLALVGAAGISDFFFLDQSFPFLLKTARAGERRSAVRVSEYESIDTALALRGLVDWVWVDCFTRFPLGRAEGAALVAAGFRLCLVSPELQGRTDASEVTELRKLIECEGIAATAVCTKRPELWREQTQGLR